MRFLVFIFWHITRNDLSSKHNFEYLIIIYFKLDGASVLCPTSLVNILAKHMLVLGSYYKIQPGITQRSQEEKTCLPCRCLVLHA